MDKLELKKIVSNHEKWFRREEGGACADLRDANLRGADLGNADLRDADLRDANLRDADLHGAYLCKADLPKIVKVENLFTKIKTAIKEGGDLEMGGWHGCNTTHCLAGWVTTLAGAAGRIAENLVGTSWAAALIINESCPYLGSKVPNFYSKNEEAMNFINECAEKENTNQLKNH